MTAKEAKIYKRIKAILAPKLRIDEKKITPQASFKNDLDADSLDTVELIIDIEKGLNISIPDEVADKMSTIGEVIEYISRNKLKVKPIPLKNSAKKKVKRKFERA